MEPGNLRVRAWVRGYMEPSSENERETATAVGCPSETVMAGKADVCRGCPGRELCLRQAAPDQDQKFIDVRMNAIRRKIIILSGKGGVGKSSIAAGLSMALAEISAKATYRRGLGTRLGASPHSVGIVDLDICGPSVPKLMAVEGESVVNSQYGWMPLKSPHHDIKVMSVGSLQEKADSAIVWRGPRKTALIKRFLKDTFWGRLDYLIFDTPPGTSDEHLTVVKTLMNSRPEGAILVTTPQDVAMATIRKEINFCSKMNLNIIGIVENMSTFVCPCCQEKWELFSRGGAERLALEYGIPLLGTIPLDPELVLCCEKGRSIFQEHPGSPAATVLLELAKTIQDMRT